MDVWAYLEERRRECEELSLGEASPPHQLQCAAEDGFLGQRGRLLGRVYLRDDAFVQVHEVVRVQGSGITREKYAYYLFVDGIEVGGYERDPTHDPALHRHCSHEHPHKRQDAGRVTFKEAIALAWEHLSQ